MSLSQRLPVFVLMISSFFWGLTWMPLKYFQSKGLEGVSLIFMSHFVLFLVVLPFSLRCRARSEEPSLSVIDFIAISIAGGGAIFCFAYALMYGNVVRVMVLFYLLPIWGVVGGCLFLNERLDTVRVFSVIAGIVGAFLILGGLEIFAAPPSWVDLLALLSGFGFAANNILFRRISAVPLPHKLTTMFFGCSVLTAAIIVLGFEALPSDLTLGTWWNLAAYTLVWLLLANIGSQWAVVRLEAGRSSIIIIVQLVVAVLSATLVGQERLSALEWFGCSLVVIAATLEASRSPDVKRRV